MGLWWVGLVTMTEDMQPPQRVHDAKYHAGLCVRRHDEVMAIVDVSRNYPILNGISRFGLLVW